MNWINIKPVCTWRYNYAVFFFRLLMVLVLFLRLYMLLLLMNNNFFVIFEWVFFICVGPTLILFDILFFFGLILSIWKNIRFRLFRTDLNWRWNNLLRHILLLYISWNLRDLWNTATLLIILYILNRMFWHIWITTLRHVLCGNFNIF